MPWHDITEALERIAQGDYNVLLPVGDRRAFDDLAKSVNRMAAQLGTTEQARQEFVASVSHEIKSPLTSISGFAQLLHDPTLTPKEREHYLDVIEEESKRLSHLSDNLLKLTALDDAEKPLDLAPVDLPAQLQSVALLMEPQWRAGRIDVELDAPEGARAPVVNGDAELLQEVWINLLSNAIKYTPAGGRITITVAAAGEGHATVSVADTGCGIPAQSLPHIFERFYRVDKARDRARGGNGLGLALAKRIVELHGGHIGVTSEPNTGSTFSVNI
jgi:signal transduction histidine kinase